MARRTGFREQYYTGTRNYFCVEKIRASNNVKLYVRFGQQIQDFFRLMCSFGTALFVDLGMIILHGWEPVRCPGKSICERLNGNKVILNMIIWRFSRFEAVSGLKTEFWEAKSRADAQYWKIHMVRRTCFSEQYYTGIRNYSAPGRLELQTLWNYV